MTKDKFKESKTSSFKSYGMDSKPGISKTSSTTKLKTKPALKKAKGGSTSNNKPKIAKPKTKK